MKVYKIISLSIITLLCVAGIIVGVYAAAYPFSWGAYIAKNVYGGDAYTDIQNAIVTVNENIRNIYAKMSTIFNISGWVCIIAFFIKLMNILGKLIEAIKDYKEYYVQKKMKEMERQASMYYQSMSSQQNNTDIQ